MPLSPSDRIHLITEIGQRLGVNRWETIDLTLRQFNLDTTDDWSGNNRVDYVIHMIDAADDDGLLAIGRHLGYEFALPPHHTMPSSWKSEQFRLFISHLAEYRDFSAEIQAGLKYFGISAFVAHNDIEPTREWQDEIESALATCDAMLALLHPGFHESNWTDQELGYAMGRDLLTVSVDLGTTPYGFIGRFQALRRAKQPKKICQRLVEILWKHPKTMKMMARSTAAYFCESDSFDAAKRRVNYLEEVAYWDSSLTAKVLAALEDNNQINQAWDVPEKLKRIVKKLDKEVPT